jgi:pantoate--beta-alanine ligase
MLELVRTRDDLRAALAGARERGLRVGLVPTMGALHAGHLRLVDEARRAAELVAVSIFVNPTQFGPNEDLGRYPRDLDGDVAKCAAAGVDVVFAPEVPEMYPPGDSTRVRVDGLTEALCGPFRPGHFEGVATVVAKLFALASPCTAVFGKKDYQQLRVLERMARDLLFDVAVVGIAIVRESDGLAMSSRNRYLSIDERARARGMPRALAAAWSSYAKGERRAGTLLAVARNQIAPSASRVDYVTLADPANLRPLSDDAALTGPTLLALAAHVGTTRLIDNMVLGEDPPPEVKE